VQTTDAQVREADEGDPEDRDGRRVGSPFGDEAQYSQQVPEVGGSFPRR